MQINTFQKRKSVRRFAPTEIEDSKLKQMLTLDAELPVFKQRLKRQSIWLAGKEAIGEVLAQYLLSYGRLIAAPYMLIPFYENNANTDLEIGFALEHLILMATELGIGSLWVSTDERFSLFSDVIINLKKTGSEENQLKLIKVVPPEITTKLDEMCLPVVVLFGYASEKRLDRVINNAIRMESAGNSRKKIESIIINRHTENLPEKLKKVFNYAILAPSKKNQQPWRIRLNKDGFDLGCLHQRQLDLGIFLSHIKIAMEHFSMGFETETFYEKSNDIEWVVKILWK